ncbi:serine hydrolase domain-containing protein [Sandaracinobacteroides hominis]|uniref:serine hydrolase domain-containing protein n=1 Tax=Sandaracinobacteroides hominis TaxID=2780086 RepID=UPI0018F3978A|nr:serine hydrolase [Sandaracinobacteroides hominis]
MRSLIPAAALLLTLASCGKVQETVDALPVASGLVARTLCTAIFVQGRSEEDVRPFELGKSLDSRLGLIKASVDREAGEVSAGPLGMNSMTAGHTPGLGCAVARPGEGPGTPSNMPIDPRPWPAGDTVSPVPPKIANPAALDAAIAAAFRTGSYGNPAVDPVTRSIVIIHNGELVRSVSARGFTPNTPQYSASMAKTISSALVGILAAQGKLAVADTGLLPEWTVDPKDPRRAISIDNLLNMESGLGFNEDYGPGGDPAQMLYAENSASLFAAGKPQRDPPGTRWYYSSGDTNILMRVARLKSGLSDAQWDAFPRNALFNPLGMRTAIFEQDAGGDFIGSTFVFAGALDWARFGLMLADGGMANGRQVVPAEWVARMSTPTALSGGRYSTQTCFRGGVPGQKGRTLELAGYAGQYVTIVPETRTVIVRLGFQPDRSAWDQERFLKAVFPALGVTAPYENRKED